MRVLVDDHTAVRQGLTALHESEGDLKVVGETENGRQAVRLAKKVVPDVVVMDVAMPVLNGIEATRRSQQGPAGHEGARPDLVGDDGYVTQFLQAGASGFLVKQTAADDLLKAIREVNAGGQYLEPLALPNACMQNMRPDPGRWRRLTEAPELTSRESEVCN